MELKEYITRLWMYYLRLEDEFYNTLDYVELSKENYATYSKEYSKLLLSIGSEIDIVCKQLCKEIEPNKSHNNITDYAMILCDYENLVNTSVKCKLIEGDFKPFENWTKDSSPEWWQSYNKVKHDRVENENYKKGNLNNVFVSLMGLYVLNRFLCKKLSINRVMKEPESKSKLFEVSGWDSYQYIGNGFINIMKSDGGMSMVYDENIK